MFRVLVWKSHVPAQSDQSDQSLTTQLIGHGGPVQGITPVNGQVETSKAPLPVREAETVPVCPHAALQVPVAIQSPTVLHLREVELGGVLPELVQNVFGKTLPFVSLQT